MTLLKFYNLLENYDENSTFYLAYYQYGVGSRLAL
jgi:uncharacterized protein (DUF2235 family)